MKASNYMALALAGGSVTRKDLQLTGLSDDLVLMVGAGTLMTWLWPGQLGMDDFTWCVVQVFDGSKPNRFLVPSSDLRLSAFGSYEQMQPKWHRFFAGYVPGGEVYFT